MSQSWTSWGRSRLKDYLSFVLVIGRVVFKRFAIFFVVHRVGTSFR
ncbi:hypothetical protein [Paenibacillus chitinolyticus]